MSLTLQVPSTYGYVLLAATSTVFVNTYHSVLTGKYRKAAKLQYPICYASAEEAAKDKAAFQFNCAQRAHSNFTENLTPLLCELLISGLRFPIASASLGAGWALARVVYAYGYTTSGPAGRYKGIAHLLFDLSLKILAVYTAVSFILEK